MWVQRPPATLVERARSHEDAYVEFRRSNRSDGQVLLRSRSPSLLSLPWELLADPEQPTPFALQWALTCSLPAGGLPEAFTTGGSLRVLMVARPLTGSDVGYRMVARPLVSRLKAVRGDVELVVLRPLTSMPSGQP